MSVQHIQDGDAYLLTQYVYFKFYTSTRCIVYFSSLYTSSFSQHTAGCLLLGSVGYGYGKLYLHGVCITPTLPCLQQLTQRG